MYELNHEGFYPLTRDYLDSFIPSDPGIYMLAILLANGTYQTFFTSQTDNLYLSLQRIIGRNYSQLPTDIEEHLDRFQCYVMYFITLNMHDKPEIQKMLTQTADPVTRIKVIHCN